MDEFGARSQRLAPGETGEPLPRTAACCGELGIRFRDWVVAGQNRLVTGQQPRRQLRARIHPEPNGGLPLVDLVASEFDPPFHGLEHLDLKGGKEHRQVGPTTLTRQNPAVLSVAAS